jgi:hypothetical protein
MIFMALAVPDIQNSGNRLQLWKDVIQPEVGLFPSAAQVADVLRNRNYAVFQGNDKLLNVLAKALCKPEERYTPGEFETAFGDAV